MSASRRGSRARHRRRRRYPMGLALGLCLVSGASVVLMVAVPEPGGLAAPAETGATALLEEGAGEAGTERRSAPEGSASATATVGPTAEPGADEEAAAGPEADEDVPVLLRAVEEEVDTADGEVRIMGGEGEVMGEGPLLTFAVEVEKGLPGEAEDFVAAVEEILGDPRSWGNHGERSLQRVDGDDADFRVLLAAPDTVDRLCAPLRTNGFVSCASGNRAVINQNRWVSGVEHFDGDLETYRIYLINHEVGHTLGRGHVFCPGEGEPAPVMQQQTLSLQGCEPNGWVHPENG